MKRIRIYSEDSGEMREVDHRSVIDALKDVHAADDDGSGNLACYRVEERGVWTRYTVRTRYVVEHDIASKGTCDAPETADGEV